MRAVWFVFGCLALLLGGIGVFLPLLPTTPFILLAVFAFGKSAPRVALWMESSPTFGPIILEWRDHGAIAPRFKALAVGMMVFSVGLGIWMQIGWVGLTIQIICICAAATYVLTRPNGP